MGQVGFTFHEEEIVASSSRQSSTIQTTPAVFELPNDEAETDKVSSLGYFDLLYLILYSESTFQEDCLTDSLLESVTNFALFTFSEDIIFALCRLLFELAASDNIAVVSVCLYFLHSFSNHIALLLAPLNY